MSVHGTFESGDFMVVVREHSTAKSDRSKLAHEMLDILVRWNVRHIFCCPGSTEAAFLDAFVDRDDVELVLVTHESIAISAAEGMARATGRPAVAYLHTNVGMANAIAHLTSATSSHAPVVILNGQKSSSLPGRGGFTTAAYARDAVRQYVKWAWVAESGKSLPGHLDRALRLSVSEPAGPVWLGVPQDVIEDGAHLAEDEASGRRGPSPVQRTRPDAEAVAAAAIALRASSRPVIVAGQEVARHGATAAVLALAEDLGAVVVHDGRRDFIRSTVPTTHPAVLPGGYAPTIPAVREADLLFFVGCRVFTEFEPPTSPEIPAGPVVIHSNVDAAEIGRLHPVDIGLVGNSDSVVQDVRAALAAMDLGPRPQWLAPVDGVATAAADVPFPGHQSLAAVIDELGTCIDPSADLVLDATTATGVISEWLTHNRADHMHSSISGSLGWGAGAALGVAFAQRATGNALKPVVVFLGDGVFQFGIQALWTAVRYKLPVVFIVLNNGSYSAVAAALHRFGGDAVRSGGSRRRYQWS
jgi:benzoylformate decarboxylase